jgi:hypothetical protein
MPAFLFANEMRIKGKTPGSIKIAPGHPLQIGAWVVGVRKFRHMFSLSTKYITVRESSIDR